MFKKFLQILSPMQNFQSSVSGTQTTPIAFPTEE